MFPSCFARQVPFFPNSKWGNSCFQDFQSFQGRNTSIPKQRPQWQESSKGERWLDFWWSTTKPSLVKVVEVQPIKNRLLLKPPLRQMCQNFVFFWLGLEKTSGGKGKISFRTFLHGQGSCFLGGQGNASARCSNRLSGFRDLKSNSTWKWANDARLI